MLFQAKCKEVTGNYTLGLMVLGVSLICASIAVLVAKWHINKVLKQSGSQSVEMQGLIN